MMHELELGCHLWAVVKYWLRDWLSWSPLNTTWEEGRKLEIKEHFAVLPI